MSDTIPQPPSPPTMPKNEGGSAFPFIGQYTFSSGMSLRDWFAGMALQGTAANPAFQNDKWEVHAAASYKAADAMLVARDGKEPS